MKFYSEKLSGNQIFFYEKKRLSLGNDTFLSLNWGLFFARNFISTGVKGSSTKVKGSSTIDYLEEVASLPATETTVGVF